jgi:sporulation protein YlmC with PRC-barrel domain
MDRKTDAGRTNGNMFSLDDLQGLTVRNTEGEDLGKLEDVVVDGGSGRVAYAVLSFGGFLGMGGKHFAIPWQALQAGSTPEYLILDVPKKRLEEAPGFDRDSPPSYADQHWGTEIYEYYGYQPYWS